jgi:hypothetical protein
MPQQPLSHTLELTLTFIINILQLDKLRFKNLAQILIKQL